jgi:hypothetical protein
VATITAFLHPLYDELTDQAPWASYVALRLRPHDHLAVSHHSRWPGEILGAELFPLTAIPHMQGHHHHHFQVCNNHRTDHRQDSKNNAQIPSSKKLINNDLLRSIYDWLSIDKLLSSEKELWTN